jgi:hypothetical protein
VTKWLDRIASRVALEVRRLDKQVRDVVRTQILKVVAGKAEGITPASIIGHIGLTERQAATVEKARQRLLGKLKGKALEKDLDKLRAKLLRERAELIAEHETRLAHALGQRAAWEKLFEEGKLKGGRRHWHKLWVASEDERTCGVCMDLDGTEATIDGLFADEFYMPPDPHPRCRCSVVLVEAKAGWRREGDAEEDVDLETFNGGWVTNERLAGTDLAEGHWVTIEGKPVFIGGGGGGGAGGGGGGASPLAPGPARVIDPEKEGWEKWSGTALGGHSEASVYEDKDGDLWYVKKADSAQHAANEVIAGKLYRVAGIPHAETELASLNGSPAIASKMMAHAGGAHPDAVGVKEGFATDAWLANWDVAGKSGENTVMGPKSLATRIESGGALLYRGMGGPKGSAFGSKVGEIDSLREQGKNPSAAYLFKNVTEADIAHGIREHVAKVTPDEIKTVVEKYGGALDATTRANLTSVLQLRQVDLTGRLPALDKAAKAATKPQAPLAPGKVFNLQHKMVKGSGDVLSEPKPATLTAAQSKLVDPEHGPGKFKLSNWDSYDHPRPDEFGTPTNPNSQLYKSAMNHAQSCVSSWKGSAQSEGAQRLRTAAIAELGAAGMVNKSGGTTSITDMDRIAVRVLYRKTQVDFAAAGLTNDDRILLFRGVHKSYTTNMAIEGYSTSESTAQGFDNGAVYKKLVPPSNVLFSWDTSIGHTGGFSNEKEYFVLHGGQFEGHGSTFAGKTTSAATVQKPSGWGGSGPLDLTTLANKLGYSYKGKQVVPKVELPAALASSKVAVPKGITTTGSGGASAYIAQYKGAKYSKSQLEAAFTAINEGKGEAGAAAASGINQHSLHGMIHDVKTKYGGVQIGGATVVSSKQAQAITAAPFAAPSAHLTPQQAKPAGAVHVLTPTYKAADLEPGGEIQKKFNSASGLVFSEDVYLYKANPAPGESNYFKHPKGAPVPGDVYVSSIGQQGIKDHIRSLQAWKAAHAPKVPAPPPALTQSSPGKPGIDAFVKKYGGKKYSSAQIAQVLSMLSGGKSEKQVALALGIPVGTVHGLKFKAKGWV